MQKQTTHKEKKKDKIVFLSRCVISFILVLALTLLAAPQTVSAFADVIHEKESITAELEETLEEYDPKYDTEPLSQTEKEKGKYIEFEDINRRTENEKHYYMSDGTYMSETYAEPVHYEDASGKMQDIDNSLVEFTENGEQKVKNAKNSFSVEFAVDLSSNAPVFSLKKAEYKLDLYVDTEFEESEQNNPLLLDIALDKEDAVKDSKSKSDSIPLEKETTLKKNSVVKAEFSKADKYVNEETVSYKNKMLTKGIDNKRLRSELKYKEAIIGTDFEYIVEPNAVKESILVNQIKDKYEYRFVIEVENLTLYLLSDGSIQAQNEDVDVVYTIPAPYMFDSNEVYSNAVKYELNKLDDYKYELMVIADEEWMNSEERAFPITIDPTVEVPYTTSNFEITRVNDENGTATGSSNWYVRHNLFGESISRLVVRFNSTYTWYRALGAELDFELKKTENGGKQVAGYFLNVCYGTTPTWSLTKSYRGDCFFAKEATGSWVNYSVVVGDEYGVPDMVFKFVTEDTMLINEASFRNFKMREYYYIPSHNVSFDNDMFSLGLDVVNSETSLTIPYYVQEMPLMPIGVYGMYVPGFSSLKQNYMSGAQNFYGKDWKLNVEQYMFKTVSNDTTFYTYIDESGNAINLSKTETINGSTHYVNESGLGYNPSTGWLGTKGNRQMYRFDSFGRVYQIQNPDGQYFYIWYNSNGSILDIDSCIIKNSSGNYSWNSYVRLYYTNNLLTSLDGIKSSSQTKATFSYDASKKLTKAVIEGKSVSVTYSSDNIASVVNSDGLGYSLTYSSSYTDVKEYSNTGNFTRFEECGKLRTAKNFQNNKQISTTTYELDTDGLVGEAAEYVSYDGIVPPKYFTKHEAKNVYVGGVWHRENVSTSSILKNEDIQSLSWSSYQATISATQMSKYKYPVLIAKFINTNDVDIDFRYKSSTSSTWINYYIDNSWSNSYFSENVAYVVVPLSTTSSSLNLYYKASSPCAISYIGIGQLESQNIVDVTTEGTNKGAIVATSKSNTETTAISINSYGQTTQETTTNSNNESYRYDYTYKTSNDSVPNKNHLINTAKEYKNGVLNVSKQYYYQNDSTADKTTRGLVTSLMTTCQGTTYTESFSYDTYGNMTKYLDQNGDTYNYTYDFRGSSNLQVVQSNINGAEVVTYNYNDYGRLKSMTNAAGTTEITQSTRNNRYSFGSLYYDYNYSTKGNLTSIQRNSSNVISYTYSNANDLQTKTFANNQKMEYTYDTYGNLKTKKSYHGTVKDSVDFTYNYNIDGNLSSIAYDGYTKSYTYPNYSQSQLESTVTIKKSGKNDFVIKNAFDKLTELYKSTTYTINGANRTHTITYKDGFGVLSSETDGSFSTSYNYKADDSLNYQQTSFSSASYRRTYQTNSNGSILNGMDDLFSYSGGSVTYKTNISYSSTGNISNLTRKRASDNYQFNNVTYTYDDAGRVKTEKNTVFGVEYLYEYDTNNNIKYVTQYNTNGTVYNKQTYNYSYDRLTSITNSNTSIGTRSYTTDTVGNHLNYGGFNLTWTRGRMLDRITDSAGTSVSFKNDENGIRYEKALTTSTGTTSTTRYFMDGSRIIAEDRNGTLIHYYYNETGVIGMRYGGVDYIFLKDALGSITEIVNSSGALYAQYAYDAWGNTVYKTTGGLSDINPFRYRGYYMDTETNWYYLQTRYYDSSVRRFINADNYELVPQLAQNIGEVNMFSYCNNNPIMFTDETGELIFTTFLITSIIIGAVIGGAISGVKAYADGARGWDLFGSIAGGAIMGGAMGAVMALGGAAGLASLGVGIAGFGLSTGVAFGISLGIGFGAGMLSYGVENGIRSDRQLSFGGFVKAGLSGVVQAAATFGIAYLGGRMGAFDKLALKPMLSGANTLNSQVTYGIAKSVMATALPSVGRSINEAMFRMLIVSPVAAGSRALINWMFS